MELSDGARVLAVGNNDEEKWYFAIVDAASVLTGSANPQQIYRRALKRHLTDEGNHTVTNCNSVKMRMTEEKQQCRLTRPAPPAGVRQRHNISTI